MSAVADRASEFRQLVSLEMRRIVGARREGVYSWMRYHLGWEDAAGRPTEAASGKMIRPVGLLLATEVLGGDPERAIPAAAAVELVHNFSLLHDDVEDRSERRRDRPTLWTLVGEAHAINTGDGMLMLAHQAICGLEERGLSAADTLRAVRELDRATLRLVHGQYLDLSFEGRSQVSISEYVEMASGKTAAMFGAPLALGAIVAGAPESTVNVFRTVGWHIGLAFQMIDDLLGIWGDPELTGKPVGDDIIARKMTYPVITALDRDWDLVGRRYAEEASGPDEVAEIARLIEGTGAREATDERARWERDQALRVLGEAQLEERGQLLLAAYADIAVGRVT